MIKAKAIKQEAVSVLTDPKRFKVLKDGWIRDNLLKLDWSPSSDKEMDFAAAQEYCKKLGGRLPECNELATLVNRAKEKPAAYPIFADTKSDWYWSNTTTAWGSAIAWVVGFNLGSVGNFYKGGSFYVRAVRSSQ